MNLKRRLLEYALNSLQANLSEAVGDGAFGLVDDSIVDIERELKELRQILGLEEA